jgi:hypothetical protein
MILRREHSLEDSLLLVYDAALWVNRITTYRMTVLHLQCSLSGNLLTLEDEGIALLLKTEIRLRHEAQCHIPEERNLQSHRSKTSKLVTQSCCLLADHSDAFVYCDTAVPVGQNSGFTILLVRILMNGSDVRSMLYP